MNKKGVIAEKTGFYIAYIFLFSFAILYAASFLGSGVTKFDTENIEDSVIAVNVLSCFSDDKLGVIDEEKLNEEELKKCFAGDKYSLRIKLDKKDGEDKVLETHGEIKDFRSVKRYVKLKDGEGILGIDYVKNKGS